MVTRLKPYVPRRLMYGQYFQNPSFEQQSRAQSLVHLLQTLYATILGINKQINNTMNFTNFVLQYLLYNIQFYLINLGIVHGINAETCGKCSLTLGAGRRKINDKINPAVGLELCVSVGDTVSKGKKRFLVCWNENVGIYVPIVAPMPDGQRESLMVQCFVGHQSPILMLKSNGTENNINICDVTLCKRKIIYYLHRPLSKRKHIDYRVYKSGN